MALAMGRITTGQLVLCPYKIKGHCALFVTVVLFSAPCQFKLPHCPPFWLEQLLLLDGGMLLPFIKLVLHYHWFNKHGGTSRKLKQVEEEAVMRIMFLSVGFPCQIWCIGCLIAFSTEKEVAMSYVKLAVIWSEFEICKRWGNYSLEL